MAGALTAEQQRAWNEDGWCVFERAVPSGQLEAAQTAASKLFPSAAEMSGPLLVRWC